MKGLKERKPPGSCGGANTQMIFRNRRHGPILGAYGWVPGNPTGFWDDNVWWYGLKQIQTVRKCRDQR